MPMRMPSSSANGMCARFRRTSRRGALALLSVLAAWPACAAEHQIVCPVKLAPQSLQIPNPPKGWVAFVPVGLWLHSAGPMDGPPSLMAVLQGDQHTVHGATKTTRWTFGNDGGTYPDGKWIACYYGASNDVIIAQRIADQATACTVAYTRNTLGRDDLDVRCDW